MEEEIRSGDDAWYEEDSSCMHDPSPVDPVGRICMTLMVGGMGVK